MKPIEVRARILEEHAQLRGLLDRARREAGQALNRSKPAAIALRSTTLALCKFMRGHLDTEDRYLLPLLETSTPWGRRRAAHLRDEHEAQRGMLMGLEDAVRRQSDPELGRAVEAVVPVLEEDMAAEERLILSPEALREDPVAVSHYVG